MTVWKSIKKPPPTDRKLLLRTAGGTVYAGYYSGNADWFAANSSTHRAVAWCEIPPMDIDLKEIDYE